MVHLVKHRGTVVLAHRRCRLGGFSFVSLFAKLRQGTLDPRELRINLGEPVIGRDPLHFSPRR